MTRFWCFYGNSIDLKIAFFGCWMFLILCCYTDFNNGIIGVGVFGANYTKIHLFSGYEMHAFMLLLKI